VLAAANTALDANYVDGNTHMVAMMAYTKLGRTDEAQREQSIATAIFKSMMQNGDGKSPKQAFVVISVDEEYALMAARRHRVVQQRLLQTGLHSYDALDTVGPDGAAVAFYFLIDRVLAAQSRALGLKPKGELRNSRLRARLARGGWPIANRTTLFSIGRSPFAPFGRVATGCC
jgi:hypothetical protein